MVVYRCEVVFEEVDDNGPEWLQSHLQDELDKCAAVAMVVVHEVEEVM